jgi:hypothetical protein
VAPSVGQLRAALLLVHPADAAPDVSTAPPREMLDAAANWFQAVSYGRLTFRVETLPRWLALPARSAEYLADPGRYLADAVTAADPFVDSPRSTSSTWRRHPERRRQPLRPSSTASVSAPMEATSGSGFPSVPPSPRGSASRRVWCTRRGISSDCRISTFRSLCDTGVLVYKVDQTPFRRSPVRIYAAQSDRDPPARDCAGIWNAPYDLGRGEVRTLRLTGLRVDVLARLADGSRVVKVTAS